jgi:hypothetical protein
MLAGAGAPPTVDKGGQSTSEHPSTGLLEERRGEPKTSFETPGSNPTPSIRLVFCFL